MFLCDNGSICYNVGKHRNFAITQVYEGIFEFILAHTFFMKICITDLPACYRSTVTMATRELCNNLAVKPDFH